MFIFLSSYNPHNFSQVFKSNNIFFGIQKIIIKDNALITKNEIEEKLRNIYNKNILFLQRSDIERSLEKIDFFEKAEVKKKYPNTIIVTIFETKPLAILYKNKSKYFLDSSTNLISFKKNINFEKLPEILGEGAENNFVYFFEKLENNNFPTNKIKKFYFFQIGRWDLQLVNDKVIKFPHNNVEDAIQKSIELLDRKDFENYNIIDLRVGGKIIVEE